MKKRNICIILIMVFMFSCSNIVFSNELLNYLSDKNTLIMNINTKSLFNSPFYKQQLEKKDPKFMDGINKMKELEKKLGISFEKISSVNIGLSTEKQKTLFQGAVNAKIDSEKLITFLKNDKEKVEKVETIPYEKATIIKVFNKNNKSDKKDDEDMKPNPALKKLTDENKENYICAVKDAIFISADIDSIKNMIDLYNGKSKKSIAKNKISKNLNFSKMISASALISDEIKSKLKDNPQSSMFTNIDILDFFIDMSNGFEIDINGVCRTPESAAQVSTTIQAYTGMLGFMAMQYGLQDMLTKLKVSTKGNNANINLNLSKEDLDKISQKLEEMKSKQKGVPNTGFPGGM